jgi:pectinesterase
MPLSHLPARTATRRYGIVALVIAMAAALLAAFAWSSSAPSTGPFSVVGASSSAAAPAAGGVYTMAAGASGKCVELRGGTKAIGAKLTQAACSAGAPRQQWRVTAVGTRYQLVNVKSGLCVDVPSGAKTSGLQLQQWGCTTKQDNQLWTFDKSSVKGKYRIVNSGTAACMSDKDGSTAGNNPIVQENCADTARMQWLFKRASSAGNTSSPAPDSSKPDSSQPGAGAAAGRTWSNKADGFATGTTGGAAGKTVTVTTYADLVKYATDTAPYVIRINAAITVPKLGDELRVTSNKTLVGVGLKGKILRGGIYLAPKVRNVIIRNLTIGETKVASDDPDDKVYDYDGIQMDTVDHIWIDHNLITRTNDGLIDSRKDTTNLTVSWNVLSDTNKAFGIGWTPNTTARMTIHHNWIHDTNQRNPSVDNVAYAHLYNNYMQNVKSYGNLARGNTKMVLENSYFENVANPYYPNTSAAKLVQRGSVVVNSKGKATTNGTAFDPKSFYPYTLDAASKVPSLLKTYAGPQANIEATPAAAGKPNAAAKPIVAADGTGSYRTVQAAIDAVPAGNTTRRVITIKPGTYRESVVVPADKPFITLQGLGSGTVIVNNHNASDGSPNKGATAAVYGHDFTATNLTISNTYGTGVQALALNLDADKAIFNEVRLLGDQDTLLVNNKARAYFVKSYVEGTVDFIFGGGIAVFNDSDIHEKRKTGGPITAASTPADKKYGFLFYKSTITGATANTTQLGRPWRQDGQVVFRESTLGATIRTAQPWIDMSTSKWQKARFFEYKNEGPGATKNGNRPLLTDAQAADYTPQKYLAGSDGWNPM